MKYNSSGGVGSGCKASGEGVSTGAKAGVRIFLLCEITFAFRFWSICEG